MDGCFAFSQAQRLQSFTSTQMVNVWISITISNSLLQIFGERMVSGLIYNAFNRDLL